MSNKKYYEEIANAIWKEIMMARNASELKHVSSILYKIGIAMENATPKSRLKNDLERHYNMEYKDYRIKFEQDIEDVISDINKMMPSDSTIKHIRTTDLFNAIRNKLIQELKVEREIWETALIIVSLGFLYINDYQSAKIKKIISKIENHVQRRMATIVVRVYKEDDERVLEVFSLDEEV